MKLSFTSLRTQDIEALQSAVGAEHVFMDEEVLHEYGHDETEDLNFMPAVVVKPSTTEEVSLVMAYCSTQNICVTPTGARTGLSGGALPVCGGVALSLERMNKIVNIDEKNHQVTTQPGVITQVLQEEVAQVGLYYAPDPASRGSCFIGGNIAENSGGPRALKYGVTKDWVLNLEVVLSDGNVIWTGANTLKNSTGYSLTQLMVGSEGTLGIVTRAVLKLIPLPSKNALMLVPFSSPENACKAVAAIFRAGVTPSALEFMERDAIEWTLDFIGDSSTNLPEEEQAHLLIELDGNDEVRIFSEVEQVVEVLGKFDCGEILFADDQSKKDELWMLRRKVGEAVKARSVYKEEDTVVPRYELPTLLKGVKQIGAKYGFSTVCYGHAGDGNLHVNIIKGELSDEQWNEQLSPAIREIFELTKSLGGTLSGEHGIGWVQKGYMDIVFNQHEMRLMREIKKVFDPQGILNPGKIFPDLEA